MVTIESHQQRMDCLAFPQNIHVYLFGLRFACSICADAWQYQYVACCYYYWFCSISTPGMERKYFYNGIGHVSQESYWLRNRYRWHGGRSGWYIDCQTCRDVVRSLQRPGQT